MGSSSIRIAHQRPSIFIAVFILQFIIKGREEIRRDDILLELGKAHSLTRTRWEVSTLCHFFNMEMWILTALLLPTQDRRVNPSCLPRAQADTLLDPTLSGWCRCLSRDAYQQLDRRQRRQEV